MPQIIAQQGKRKQKFAKIDSKGIDNGTPACLAQRCMLVDLHWNGIVGSDRLTVVAELEGAAVEAFGKAYPCGGNSICIRANQSVQRARENYFAREHCPDEVFDTAFDIDHTDIGLAAIALDPWVTFIDIMRNDPDAVLLINLRVEESWQKQCGITVHLGTFDSLIEQRASRQRSSNGMYRERRLEHSLIGSYESAPPYLRS